MFAEFAPRLRDMGWLSLIPIVCGEKRPAIPVWQRFNHGVPTDGEIDTWGAAYPSAGIGLAYGPDRVIAVDLDFLDQDTAAAAHQATLDALGDTPLKRVGRAPKQLLVYRRPADLAVPGKAFGGFEIFSRSGQTVLYGRHPDTGGGYYWPYESPATISPCDLPSVDADGIVNLIEALSPLCARRLTAPRVRTWQPDRTGASGSGASDRTLGTAAFLLPRLRTAPDPLQEATAIIEALVPGERYPMAFGAVMALTDLGYPDASVREAVFPAYLALFPPPEQRRRRNALESAIRWARRAIGPDDVAIHAMMAAPMASIAAAWNARWRRGA